MAFVQSKMSLIVCCLVLIVGYGCDKAGQEAVDEAAGTEEARKKKTEAPGASRASKPKPNVWPPKVRAFLKAWETKEGVFQEEYANSFKSELVKRKAFAKLSKQVYEHRDYEALFTKDGVQLNAAGEAMHAAVVAIGSHGLDPKAYHQEAIQAVVAAIDTARLEYEKTWNVTQGGKTRALWRALNDLKKRDASRLLPAEIEEAISRTNLTDEDVSLIGDVDALLKRVFDAKAALNLACIQADLALLGAFFRYAYDMRFARTAHPFDADRDYWSGVKKRKDLLYDQYLALDFDDLKSSLGALVPHIPEYRAMQAGLAFYNRLAAEVEQTKLPKKVEKLSAGKKDDLVKLLQKRLKEEEYYDGEITGHYDEATVASVRLYQDTHQLKVTGDMDRVSRRSMNRSFKTRAGQVELALMRHRESELHQGEWRFGSVPLQSRVNIAGFKAKFYKDGQLARQHRVIVGNNGLSVDERSGHKGWFNRTRLFSREMVTVVLNPTWRVPKRIKEQELDRELLEDPAYYENNGYEVRILDNGTEEVMQLSGPGNALGQVKFLFPNRFSIYMHDTPKRSLFKRHIRAFSHGCMRLEDPVDLARWLLIEQGAWSEKKLQKVLNSRKVYGVPLKTKMPVTIEYNTVGVHETGRMMFYIDIYRFDRDYHAGKTPYPQLPGRSLEQAVLAEKSDGK
jgi:murein L,D-transpeptidase YcbB/YkuD